MSKKSNTSTDGVNLLNILTETLNKKFKESGKVAYFMGNEETPTDVTEWLSTKSTLLDLSISNRKYGGIPVGRITEISGLESSGKSLLAGHIAKSTQEKNGIVVYIDTETAMSEQFMKAIGVDLTKMIYLQVDTVEDVFSSIESIISTIQNSNQEKKLVTIIVDSLAALSTKDEMLDDYDKDGYATGKAILISKALRKITRLIGKERVALVFTNQLREKMGVMFGEKYTTSGGKALPFHSSVRIRLAMIAKIKIKTETGEDVIGIKVQSSIQKNRMGPPFRKAEFDIYFDRGIVDYDSWIKILKDYDIVTKSEGGYKLLDQDNNEIKFKAKDWIKLLTENEQLKTYLYEKICDLKIMKYASDEKEFLDVDEVTTDTEE